MIRRPRSYSAATTSERAAELFASADVARLATVDSQGRPHLVPIVFAIEPKGDGHVIYTAVDHKPKRTTQLRRIENVRANPAVCVLTDHYTEDWDELWWARADGHARVLEDSETEAIAALASLVRRYPQYRVLAPGGPVIAIDVDRITGWEASTRSGSQSRAPE